MRKFKIYSGLSGGFGGAKFDFEDYFENEDEALEEAYIRAIEEYQSYEGMYGIMSYEDCKEELFKTYGYASKEEINEYYIEEVESWIEYFIEEVEEDDN